MQSVSSSSDSKLANAVFAGMIAGASGILIGHPFDTLKVRLQVGSSLQLNKSHNPYSVLQLYRGLLPPFVTAGMMASINFAIYESTKKKLKEQYFNDRNSQSHHLWAVFYAAATSGTIMTVMAAPIGMVKVHQQIASEKGVINTIKDLYRSSNNSIRPFFRGVFPVFIMEAVGRGVYMTTYEFCKTSIISYQDSIAAKNNPIFLDIGSTTRNNGSTAINIASAVSAGIISWFVIYPFDVIKARMQMDFNSLKYSSTYDCFKKTMLENRESPAVGSVGANSNTIRLLPSIRNLYRGLAFTLVRAGPVAATVLPIYELTKDFLDSFSMVVAQ